MRKKLVRQASGYYKQTLGFTAACGVCNASARMVAFSRVTREVARAGGGEPIQMFTIGDAVCSFDCFTMTKDYVGPNPPLDAPKEMTAR